VAVELKPVPVMVMEKLTPAIQVLGDTAVMIGDGQYTAELVARFHSCDILMGPVHTGVPDRRSAFRQY